MNTQTLLGMLLVFDQWIVSSRSRRYCLREVRRNLDYLKVVDVRLAQDKLGKGA